MIVMGLLPALIRLSASVSNPSPPHLSATVEDASNEEDMDGDVRPQRSAPKLALTPQPQLARPSINTPRDHLERSVATLLLYVLQRTVLLSTYLLTLGGITAGNARDSNNKSVEGSKIDGHGGET